LQGETMWQAQQTQNSSSETSWRAHGNMQLDYLAV